MGTYLRIRGSRCLLAARCKTRLRLDETCLRRGFAGVAPAHQRLLVMRDAGPSPPPTPRPAPNNFFSGPGVQSCWRAWARCPCRACCACWPLLPCWRPRPLSAPRTSTPCSMCVSCLFFISFFFFPLPSVPFVCGGNEVAAWDGCVEGGLGGGQKCSCNLSYCVLVF